MLPIHKTRGVGTRSGSGNMYVRFLMANKVLFAVIALALFVGYFFIRGEHLSTHVYLVTGGSGFVGKNLVRKILSRDETSKVVVMDSTPLPEDLKSNKRVTFQFGDISKPDIFNTLPASISHVIHLAALVSQSESGHSPTLYSRVNVQGAKNLLDWVATRRISHVVTASSAAVYGAQTSLPASEDAPLNPLSQYARSKVDMEAIHMHANNELGVQSVLLRLPGLYGPEQSQKSEGSTLPASILDQAMRGDDISMHGDTAMILDLMFIEDAVDVILKVTDSKPPRALYNVGCNAPISQGEFIQLVKQEVDSRSSIVKASPQAWDVSVSVNPSLLCSDLHVDSLCTRTLGDGLKETASWLSSHMKFI